MTVYKSRPVRPLLSSDQANEATQTPTRPQQDPREKFLRLFHDVRPATSQRSILTSASN